MLSFICCATHYPVCLWRLWLCFTSVDIVQIHKHTPHKVLLKPFNTSFHAKLTIPSVFSVAMSGQGEPAVIIAKAAQKGHGEGQLLAVIAVWGEQHTSNDSH